MKFPSQPSIVIVGAGMSGIATAVRLLGEGYNKVTLVERAGDFGGTWRDNVYPGVACDVPSALYSYSFAPKPAWSRIFAPGSEINEYLGNVAAQHYLRDRTRFGVSVEAATWADNKWHIDLSDSTTLTAEVLVAATGVLRDPVVPDIAGLQSFAGRAFHSARWDAEAVIDGARVAVVGTGSTGVQLVNNIAGRARHLEVFQRTPQWILPARNKTFSAPAQALMSRFPGIGHAMRLVNEAVADFIGGATVTPGLRRQLVQSACRRNLATVMDPALRAKLTPDDEPMCRRMVMADGFYRTVERPDVDLVTESIERIEPAGIRTKDGVLHETDVIVFATGFEAHKFMRPIALTGVGGRTIDDEWADGARAYKTVALPSFPNFFMLLGPYSPFGNQSQISVAETQIGYLLQWLRARNRSDWNAAAPSAAATDSFNEDIRRVLTGSGTVWTTGCTKAWYRGEDGLPQLWPWHSRRHQKMLQRPDLNEWEKVS